MFLENMFVIFIIAVFFDKRFSFLNRIIIFMLFLFLHFSNITDAQIWFYLWDIYWFLLIINLCFIFNRCILYWMHLFFFKLGWQKCSFFVSWLAFLFSLNFISFLVNRVQIFLEEFLLKKNYNKFFGFFLLFLCNILVTINCMLCFFMDLFENYCQLFFNIRSKKLKWNDLPYLIKFILITLVIAHILGVSRLLIIWLYFFIRASYAVILEAKVIYKKNAINLNFFYWFFKFFSALVYDIYLLKKLKLFNIILIKNKPYYNMVYCFPWILYINPRNLCWKKKNNIYYKTNVYFFEMLLWSECNYYLGTYEQLDLAFKLSRLLNLNARETRVIVKNFIKNYSEKIEIFSLEDIDTLGAILMEEVRESKLFNVLGLALLKAPQEHLLVFFELMHFLLKAQVNNKINKNIILLYFIPNEHLKRPVAAMHNTVTEEIIFLKFVLSEKIWDYFKLVDLLVQCSNENVMLILVLPKIFYEEQLYMLTAEGISKYNLGKNSKELEQNLKLYSYHILFSDYTNLDGPWNLGDSVFFREWVNMAELYYSELKLKKRDSDKVLNALFNNLMLLNY